MRFQVNHTTIYAYAETVPLCHNEVYLTPRQHEYQQYTSHRLAIEPKPSMQAQRRDYFGNESTYFMIDRSHRTLQINATSQVDITVPIAPNPSAGPAWECVRKVTQSRANVIDQDGPFQFLFDSPVVQRSEQFRKYADLSFEQDRPVIDAVFDLTHRIHNDFDYDPTATTIDTPLAEVLAVRRGVCQDFSHLQIACLRSLGLAARYVSGYLLTQTTSESHKLVGADASHAWVSVHCGELGWIDFDPTNNVMPHTDHVTLAWGRDYTDVNPIRGLCVGGGKQHVTVAVEVVPF